MPTKAEIWLRPWALFTGIRHLRALDPAAPGIVVGEKDWPYLFCSATGFAPPADLPRHAAFSDHNTQYRVLALPVPRSPRAGVELEKGTNPVRVIWPDAPDRPPARLDPQTDGRSDFYPVLP